MNVQVTVISLVTAQERRRLLSESLKFHEGFEWSFFDALNHEAPLSGIEVDHDAQMREYGRSLTKGEVGCFKSHVSVLRRFLTEGKTDWLLVLEDDVWFDPDFSVGEVVDFAEKRGIGYIRLFAKMYKPADIVGQISNFRQIVRFRTDPYGTQAYLIDKKKCAALLASIRSIDVPFDDALGRFWEHGLDAYSVFPFPAVERSVPSSLTANRDASSAERVHYARQRIFRRLDSKFRKELYNIRYRLAQRRAGKTEASQPGV